MKFTFESFFLIHLITTSASAGHLAFLAHPSHPTPLGQCHTLSKPSRLATIGQDSLRQLFGPRNRDTLASDTRIETYTDRTPRRNLAKIDKLFEILMVEKTK